MTEEEWWLAQLRDALEATPLSEAEREEVTRECKTHLRGGEEHPVAVFGDPEEYAAAAALSRMPAARRALLDISGRVPGERWPELPRRIAMRTAYVAAAVLVLEGSQGPVTVAGLAAWALLSMAIVLGVARYEALAVGRLVPWHLLGVADIAALVLAAVAWSVLPRDLLVVLPTWWVLGGSLLLALVALGVDVHYSRRADERLVRRAAAGESVDATDRLDGESWLRRLPGVLHGRHDWSLRDAKAAGAECRRHLADGVTGPREEYGPVAQYALRLQESAPERGERRFGQGYQRQMRFAAVLYAAALWQALSGNFGWLLILVVYGIGSLLLLGLGVAVYAARLRSDPGEGTPEPPAPEPGLFGPR